MSKASFGVFTSLRGDLSGSSSKWPESIGVTDDVLRLHLDRLRESAKALDLSGVYQQLEGHAGLELFRAKIQEQLSPAFDSSPDIVKTVKIRVAISQTGEWDVHHTVLQATELKDCSAATLVPTHLPAFLQHPVECVVYLDTMPTEPSLFTRHKTTYRQPYDNARARVGIASTNPIKAEVLLWNPHGEIMEASLCTPYFFRLGTWATPSINSGGNIGVTRRVAISKGLCEEEVIKKQDLVDGEIIYLSNAVRGFFQGQVRVTANLDSQNKSA